MVWLAFDDTDSVRGGCTTHVALEILRALPDFDLIGFPRLVRLNPNVPWKTRGNGAVVLRLGHGRGRGRVAGHAGSMPLRAFESGDDLNPAETDAVWTAAQRLVNDSARLEDPNTNPGLVLFRSRPAPGLYREAVHRIVSRENAASSLAGAQRVRSWKGGRGLLGAASAASWPGTRGTYEWIAYRAPHRWGTPRSLDPGIGAALDARFPSTFDNWDARRRHLRIEPRSPCPVLAGIRSTDSEGLPAAGALLGPEPSESALLFATNQATDEHLRPGFAGDLQPFSGVEVTGRVTHSPRVTPGGHVFARLEDGTGAVTVAAYEPTKEFRAPLRALRPGDILCAAGAVHADPRLVALEKVRILATAPRVRARPPACDACSVRMKSRGRARGWQCKHCRRRLGPGALVLERVDGAPRIGEYEVPVLVRRHLSRPLGLTPAALLVPA